MIDKDRVIETAAEMFGDKLADPHVFPACFAYQLRLAQYELEIQSRQGVVPSEPPPES